jgi:hypothetical protein
VNTLEDFDSPSWEGFFHATNGSAKRLCDGCGQSRDVTYSLLGTGGPSILCYCIANGGSPYKVDMIPKRQKCQ